MTIKQKIIGKQLVVGTFIKTPHFHNTEVLAHSNLDVLCLDAEHAPFDRAHIDACILAAKSQQKPVIVRVQDTSDSSLLNVLDLGADGVVLPHIKNGEQAKDIIAKCFYGNNGRGYAGSSRFAGYTTKPLAENLANNKRNTTVIAQIEDADALTELDAICAIDEIDCIFIGRMDLTISLGETNPKADSVIQAVNTIVDKANQYNKAIGMFVGDLSELGDWIKKGVSVFLLGSDHNFMLSGAQRLVDTVQQAKINAE
ncbi:aldolase [Alteromonadaceae bacterium M269]|nr:aldolase [Alteromonadaceae bacterium M269]